MDRCCFAHILMSKKPQTISDSEIIHQGQQILLQNQIMLLKEAIITI